MTYVRFIVYILSKFPACEESYRKNVTPETNKESQTADH